MIVFCNEGYTSSLAAASLQDLGMYRATDLVGGFRAWQAAGLPVDRVLRYLSPEVAIERMKNRCAARKATARAADSSATTPSGSATG